MNYDIDFKIKLEGVDRWVYLDPCCDAVITSSASEMIRKSTGLNWDACGNNGLCVDHFNLCEFGKTVFLTREEAEAALKKMNEGDE